MSRGKEWKEKVRQVTERLDGLLDELEAAFEEYRRQLDAAGLGEEPREGEETLRS